MNETTEIVRFFQQMKTLPSLKQTEINLTNDQNNDQITIRIRLCPSDLRLIFEITFSKKRKFYRKTFPKPRNLCLISLQNVVFELKTSHFLPTTIILEYKVAAAALF